MTVTGLVALEPLLAAVSKSCGSIKKFEWYTSLLAAGYRPSRAAHACDLYRNHDPTTGGERPASSIEMHETRCIVKQGKTPRPQIRGKDVPFHEAIHLACREQIGSHGVLCRFRDLMNPMPW